MNTELHQAPHPVRTGEDEPLQRAALLMSEVRAGSSRPGMGPKEPMNAGDLCNRLVSVTERQTSLVEAAQIMRQNHVGCLVVVEGQGDSPRVVGLLTDRDIVTSVIAQGIDPATLCVGDVMAAEPVTVGESDSFIDLLRTMRRHGLRRLPVTTSAGNLVGLVTLDDTLEILAEQMQTLVQAIGTQQRLERERRR